MTMLCFVQMLFFMYFKQNVLFYTVPKTPPDGAQEASKAKYKSVKK